MRLTTFILCAAIFAAAISLSPPAIAAHKFYTSFAQVEYNSERETVEVALRVFGDDLESVLTRRHGKAIHIGKTENGAKLIFDYLADCFQLRNRDGAAKKFEWVGMETKGDVTWLYFEARMPEGLTGATLRNRLLLDFSDEQVNIVHVRRGNQKADLVFKANDGDFKNWEWLNRE
ncbi:MAG TPA: DUF6702 family protein [Pyrinomonadaceae bacterium]|jgi:hypothetical protein|nr:DUF6702 family protein [Pyrinomonadaceae bacterium]